MADLASRLDIAEDELLDLEDGERRPTLEQLQRIADRLGVSVTLRPHQVVEVRADVAA